MNEDRIADFVLIGGYITIIVLRIFNVIDWGWQWILLPFWLPVMLAIGGLIIGLIIGIPMYINRKIKERKNERY